MSADMLVEILTYLTIKVYATFVVLNAQNMKSCIREFLQHFFTREVSHDNINLDQSLFHIFGTIAFIKKNQY